MPTLNWIGKQAVVRHHKDVPFRLLEPVPALSCGEDGKSGESGNLIVQGDNLHALKALLPRYAGQVKCIYIDPPYNTGNDGWVYNDNVNSPEIRKWLGEVVGKEGETLDRHDRWLCMMYPRLVLLKQFLREDGAIFVSIDDNEVATLRLVMDEVFGTGNFVATNIWQKKYARQNDSLTVSTAHDFVIAYANNLSSWRPGRIVRSASQTKGFSNPDNDPRGLWQSVVYTCAKNRTERPNLFYPIKNPITLEQVFPEESRVWGCDAAATQVNAIENRLWWGDKGQLSKPRKKVFLSELAEGVVPDTIWFRDQVGDTQDAKRELMAVFGDSPFQTPKPSSLIQRILQIASDKDSLILDSFAGSGTTGHAVLKQNAEDGGTRRFILVEMDAGIAQNVTAERVKRVAAGYTNAKAQAVPGLGGGFQFCRLSGEALFTASGQIRSDVTFDELAEFVWFSETGSGLADPEARIWIPGQARNDVVLRTPLLGIHKGTAIYLLYNGILKDRGDLGGNVLNARTLAVLPPHDGARVVFAARSRFDRSKLARLGIEFRQLPYELTVKSWA